MATKQIPSRLVPFELIPGLRLSKPLPGVGDSGGTRVQVVHGEENTCLGFLVTRSWGLRGIIGIDDHREYFIFTSDFHEASYLASLDEESLKSAYQLPVPKKEGAEFHEAPNKLLGAGR